MAANATNIPGAAAPDAEIKGNMQIARIRHAAPVPKQTTPKAIFSTKPASSLAPASVCGHHWAGSMDGR